MREVRSMRPSARLPLTLLSVALLSCSGGGGNNGGGGITQPPQQNNQASISLSASPATASVTAGQSGQVTINITRSQGFTGSVALTLDSPPTGITGSFSPASTTGNTSSLTITVVASMAAGSHTLTVRGSSSGVQDKTAQVTVTVAASGPIGFALSADPVEMELPAGKGWSANGIVSIQRLNGFTGAVNVSVSGFTSTAIIAATPATIAAGQTASNAIGLATDGTAPGVYTGLVKATAAGFADVTIPIRIRVSLPTTGSITWKFCRADRAPKYFAVRDGNGAWQHIVPNGPAAATTADPATYSFNIAGSTASVAMVWLGEKTSGSPLIEGHHWNVFYLTRQEAIDLAAEECITSRETTTRTSSASMSGYQSFDAVIGSVSRYGLVSPGSTGTATTTLAMQNLPPGAFDLLVTRSSFAAGTGPDIAVQSVVLRRAVNPATGGTIAAVNFASEGVAPATGALTFANTNGETFTNTMTFRTTDGLNAWIAAAGQFGNLTRTWYGVPASKMVAGDLHQLTTTTSSTTARRQVITFARDVGPRTITFGPTLAVPTVTALASPWLVRATGTLSSDYTSRVSIYFRESTADPRTMTIVASRGFLGGSNQYDVQIPDISAATGATAFWNLRRGAAVKWTLTGGEGATGDLLTDVNCVLTGFCRVVALDGATYRSAQATGTITIP